MQSLFLLPVDLIKTRTVTELPRSPASGKFYMKHKIVLFQRMRYGFYDFQSKIMINARSANATINLLKKY
jgi:hypothetical protein